MFSLLGLLLLGLIVIGVVMAIISALGDGSARSRRDPGEWQAHEPDLPTPPHYQQHFAPHPATAWAGAALAAEAMTSFTGTDDGFRKNTDANSSESSGPESGGGDGGATASSCD